MKRRHALWSLLLLVPVLAGCGCFGLWWFVFPFPFIDVNETAHWPNVSATYQERAAKLTMHTFPPSTKFLYYHLEGFQDLMLHVKVEMPPDDVQELIASGPFHCTEIETRTNELAFHTTEPFAPGKVTKFRCVSGEPAVARHVTLLIDDGRPDVATVYLMYSER